MRFLVLGGGVQGSAAAFDLLRDDAVAEVVVADARPRATLPALKPHLGGRLRLARIDAGRPDTVEAVMGGVDGALCALPYFFNAPMARLAVEAGAHFTDLGGNTAIVEEQRALDEAARRQGVSVIPDVGLAPGIVNVLAQAGISALDSTESVRIMVGGLPQNPKPPLDYQVVYSLEGMLDYYVTPACVLRDGRETTVEALSGLETVDFGPPTGPLEAFYTGGGASTLPQRYRNRISTLEYKTLRYPGHARVMRAIRDLGLLIDEDVDYDGTPVNPRRFFIERVAPQLTFPEGRDLVIGRVEAVGERDGRAERIRYDLLDRHDPETGISAMARTTGFSLATVALMQVRGQVSRAGVGTPDEAIPPDVFLSELARRGIRVTRS